MTKELLRQLYREKRRKLSLQQIREFSTQIIGQADSAGFLNFESFHIFVPISGNREVDTLPLISRLFERQKSVVVPKTEGREMLNCLIKPDTEFVAGHFGVPEPVEFEPFRSDKIDIVFVPMFVCDKLGNRVGYGGGYYDRFLAGVRPDCLKVGLNFFEPVPEIDDVTDTDIRLDYCVTSEGIVSFGNGSSKSSK